MVFLMVEGARAVSASKLALAVDDPPTMAQLADQHRFAGL